jgi:dihydropteroate synthase
MTTVVPGADSPPSIMAVLNATPDSFAGDGLGSDPQALLGRARQAVAEGADILDLGAESTRPGSTPVPAEVELARVSSVLPEVLRLGLPVSIDTQKPRIAQVALSAGAVVLNDVSGLADPDLARVAADHGAYLVLTHNGWTTGRERDVVSTLQALVEQALKAGVPHERLILDPGLGFGKSPEQSLRLVRELDTLLALGLPFLVGASRKGFIGHVLDLPPAERLEGSLACAAIATYHGASILRVHDVQPSVHATRMAWAVRGAPRLSSPLRR